MACQNQLGIDYTCCDAVKDLEEAVKSAKRANELVRREFEKNPIHWRIYI